MPDLPSAQHEWVEPDEPAWWCPECEHKSYAGYFASGAVCPKCPDRPEMERIWQP